MKGNITSVQDPEEDPANIKERELSTNQQAVSVPWFVGMQKVSLKWLSQPIQQFTREAPLENPGKK